MAFTFENAAKWSRFEELTSHVWFHSDLGSPEWREMNALIGMSDWAAHIPYSDFAEPKKMCIHARSAMVRATGYDPKG